MLLCFALRCSASSSALVESLQLQLDGATRRCDGYAQQLDVFRVRTQTETSETDSCAQSMAKPRMRSPCTAFAAIHSTDHVRRASMCLCANIRCAMQVDNAVLLAKIAACELVRALTASFAGLLNNLVDGWALDSAMHSRWSRCFLGRCRREDYSLECLRLLSQPSAMALSMRLGAFCVRVSVKAGQLA
jgi:hypothetical protein